eukprot:1985809-Pyramimonas_sp.AAC.1
MVETECPSHAETFHDDFCSTTTSCCTYAANCFQRDLEPNFKGGIAVLMFGVKVVVSFGAGTFGVWSSS